MPEPVTAPLPGAPQVVTPAAAAAFAAAEAAWYEANGTAYHRLIEAWGHKLAQDMWAAALEWAARQQPPMIAHTEGGEGRAGEWDKLDDHTKNLLREHMGLLRQGGEGGQS